MGYTSSGISNIIKELPKPSSEHWHIRQLIKLFFFPRKSFLNLFHLKVGNAAPTIPSAQILNPLYNQKHLEQPAFSK